MSVALFNSQNHLLPFDGVAFKNSPTNLFAAAMVICFGVDRVRMEMTGQASIEEEFGKGTRRPFLHITLERPTIEKVEPRQEIIVIEDSSKEE